MVFQELLTSARHVLEVSSATWTSQDVDLAPQATSAMVKQIRRSHQFSMITMVFTAQEDITAHLEPMILSRVRQVLIIPTKMRKANLNAVLANKTHSMTSTALKVANLVFNSQHQKKKLLFALA